MPTPLERDIQWASFAQHLTDQTPVFDRQILDQIEQAQHTLNNQVGWAPNPDWDDFQHVNPEPGRPPMTVEEVRRAMEQFQRTELERQMEREAVRRWEQMTGNHIINEQQIKIKTEADADDQTRSRLRAEQADGIYGG
jgi:hypothetical protein